jgi:hypothetical protein
MVPQFTNRQPVGGVERVTETGPPQFWTTPIEDKSGSGDEQLTSHARNFLDCVRSREQPVSELESAHQVSTACHLANISLRTGRQVRWDPAAQSADDAEINQQLTRPYRAPWDAALRALGVG